MSKLKMQKRKARSIAKAARFVANMSPGGASQLERGHQGHDASLGKRKRAWASTQIQKLSRYSPSCKVPIIGRTFRVTTI